MTDSANNNNNFNMQHIIDKVKAMVTPEKRAEMMTKVKTIWAVINEKPAESKSNSEVKLVIQEKTEEKNPVDSNINIETKPLTQEKIEEKKPEESEQNKI